MTPPTDPVLEVLREIQHEVRAMNETLRELAPKAEPGVHRLEEQDEILRRRTDILRHESAWLREQALDLRRRTEAARLDDPRSWSSAQRFNALQRDGDAVLARLELLLDAWF